MKLTVVSLKQFYLIGIVVFMLAFNSKSNAQGTLTYPYSGAAQTFIVPSHVCTIHIKAWGAGGGGGGNDAFGGGPGGGGSFVESVITVVPGDVITIYTGGGGFPGAGGAGTAGGAGGFGKGKGGNGGNAGPDCCSGSGGGGGGSSGVLRNGAQAVFAAGGGGGGGGGCKSPGGRGGSGGANGGSTTCSTGGNASANGAQNGGAGQTHPADGGGGGGGGGGTFNGGQGGFAPPVGGSCNPSTDCGAGGGGGGQTASTGTNTTIINGSGQAAGNTGDPDYPTGASVGGGVAAKGKDGFLLLDYTNTTTIAFSNTTACYVLATQFTDNTTNSAGTVTAWTWDFGDGTPLNNTQSPSHFYPAAGFYNATLIVYNSFGCSDTLTKVVQVLHKPTANFSHSYACAGFPMFFTNSSFVNSASSITGYSWDFGDGTPASTLQDPIHTYPLPGNYNVTLVTTTVDGCTDMITYTVIIYDAPGSDFTFSNICLRDSAHFTNTTTDPTMGTIASWVWDFGDGTPSNTTIWSPGHLYTFAGNYLVTLITYSSNGCADTARSTITVFVPHAYFGFTDVCYNEVMNFNDLSSVSGGTITAWQWNFGNSSALNTTQNPGYTYPLPGTYTVTLIATSDIGCKDTVDKSVVVHPLPTAKMLITNVCDGGFAQFNDQSTILNPDVVSGWSWTFGDGTSVNNQNTSHLYAALGTYPVQLLAVSSFGCKDSVSKMLVVNPNPVVKFTVDDSVGCEPLCVSFQDLSTVLTGVNALWAWNAGDGSAVNNSRNFDHCYSNDSIFAPNIFDVTLTVTSDSGCSTTLLKTNYITVYPLPIAGFSTVPDEETIINPIISVIDASTGANFWHWNFGDLDTAFGIQPLPHTYADTGTYQIALTVTTQYGCIDVEYHNIYIGPDFVFYIPNAFTPNADGVNDSFIGKGIFIKEYEMLIFDRWGKLIYKTDSIDKPWDGKANNGSEIAQIDVYVYVVVVTDFKFQKHNYSGIVTLVK